MNKLLTALIFMAGLITKAYCCTSSIAIAATSPASDTVCAGATLTFTASITENGGTNPTYQWKVNSANGSGTSTGATYTYSPAAGDVVTCVLTNSCGTITSNSLYPVVNPVLYQKPSETFCTGYNTSAISLGGATWTNNNTSIGLAASGAGDIPSFMATNNNANPVTAIITAIQTCTTTDTAVFSIIINPVPTVDTITNQSVCVGQSIPAISFSSPQPNAFFTWTNDNPAIGLTSSGTDSIPSFIAANSGNTAITAHITITPTTSGYAYMTDALDDVAYSVSRATNTLVSTIQNVGGEDAFSTGITASSDGNWVYITNNNYNTVSVINAATNTVVNTLAVGNSPYGIVISPNQKWVYVANSGDGTISIISTATNTVTGLITLPGGPADDPQGIAISPDGSMLYVTQTLSPPANGGVYFIQAATNKVVDSVTVQVSPSGIVVSPDGSKVYVANNTSSTISTINVSNKMVTTSGIFTNDSSSQVELNGVALSPSGDTLYVASFWDGAIAYYNTKTSPPTRLGVDTLPGGSQEAPVGVSVSADGLFAYASNAGEGTNSTLEVIKTAVETVISSDTIINPVTAEEISYSFGNFVTGVNCTGTPFTFTITVNPVSAPQVSLAITNGSQTSCTGSPVTFTATPVNGGLSPQFNFLVDDVSVQNGAKNTFTSSTLSNGNTISCILTSNSACATVDTAASNTLTITIMNSTTDTINQTICFDSSYAGHNASGTYLDTFLNAGCDSFRLLYLTVLTPDRDTIYHTICTGGTYLGYSQTGIYTDHYTDRNGCDSARTLNLTVSGTITTSVNATICFDSSYDGHDSSGEYVDTLTSGGGCDSIRTLSLVVLPAYDTTIKINACDGDTVDGHSATGIYVNHYVSSEGCDSTINLELSFYAIPPKPSVTQDNDTLSTEPGYTYQWYYNFNQVGTDSSRITISESGSYYVVVSSNGECLVISDTVNAMVSPSGIKNINRQPSLTIFPNPSDGIYHLQIANNNTGNSLHMEIYNALGQLVSSNNYTTAQANSGILLDLSTETKGLYLMRVELGNWVGEKTLLLE